MEKRRGGVLLEIELANSRVSSEIRPVGLLIEVNESAVDNGLSEAEKFEHLAGQHVIGGEDLA